MKSTSWRRGVWRRVRSGSPDRFSPGGARGRGTRLMYTMAAPVILVVSKGTTRLLSNSPAHYLAEASPQTNYDTSQLYHGFLMVWVVPSSSRASPSKEDIVNFRMVQSPRSHGTTTAYMVVKFVAIVLMDNCPKYHVHYLYRHPSAGNYPVKNWIIASRWMHINWYKLASRQVSLLTHWSLMECEGIAWLMIIVFLVSLINEPWNCSKLHSWSF